MFFKKTNDSLYENKSGDIKLYFITLDKLQNMFKNIKIWRLNRPVDILRVNEIKNFFIEKNSMNIPGQISGWINENKELEIYDGWHRYCASIQSEKNMFLFIKIMSCNHENIIQDFKNLNKSINVPYLYFEENNNKKKQVCEKLAEKLCNSYPNCMSTSRYPQPQNFNRDNFIELLSSLDIDFYIENLEIKLWEELIGLNLEAKNYISSHKIKTPKKCDYNKFWLFYLSKDYIKTKLIESVKN